MKVIRVTKNDLDGGAFGGIARTGEVFTIELTRHEARIFLDRVLPREVDPLTGVSGIRKDLQKLLDMPSSHMGYDQCVTCGGQGRIVRFEPWKSPIELCHTCHGTGRASI